MLKIEKYWIHFKSWKYTFLPFLRRLNINCGAKIKNYYSRISTTAEFLQPSLLLLHIPYSDWDIVGEEEQNPSPGPVLWIHRRLKSIDSRTNRSRTTKRSAHALEVVFVRWGWIYGFGGWGLRTAQVSRFYFCKIYFIKDSTRPIMGKLRNI